MRSGEWGVGSGEWCLSGTSGTIGLKWGKMHTLDKKRMELYNNKMDAVTERLCAIFFVFFPNY
jgi:hypothetical protein